MVAEDIYRNPHSLFDVRNKSAIVTGASGAFGVVAAKVLAGAGAKLTLVAGSKEALAQTARAVPGAWGRRRGDQYTAEFGKGL